MVANLAVGLTGFRSYTCLNYDLPALLLVELPTLESGLAKNRGRGSQGGRHGHRRYPVRSSSWQPA